MRLIDADALKKDDELAEWITRDTIRTGKMLKAFSELFVKKIDDAPTVNAVSEEVYTREYNLRKEAEMKVYKLEKALEQEPKTGHWIGHREHCENLGVMPSGLGAYEWCSNCDCGIDVREWHRNHYNYCPNCGAKMAEPEEL